MRSKRMVELVRKLMMVIMLVLLMAGSVMPVLATDESDLVVIDMSPFLRSITGNMKVILPVVLIISAIFIVVGFVIYIYHYVVVMGCAGRPPKEDLWDDSYYDDDDE